MISKRTLNLGCRDEIYVLSNGHETCQDYYDLIIMEPMYIYTLECTSETLKDGISPRILDEH